MDLGERSHRELTCGARACLSGVHQASSIQNYGVTCESVTVGHNPFPLPLAANSIALRGARPLFLCEKV